MTMNPSQLRTAWLAAWQGLGVQRPDEALFAELLTRHREPHRAYHTLQHLGECLDWLAAQGGQANRPAEVAIALWFHDAIYDVQAHDNEQRSADWAERALLAAGVPDEVAGRIHAMVMATRHDAPPAGGDVRLLVDIDLAILGAAPERFAQYERQIRIEYAHVPAADFEKRRREILGAFLARDPLYRTPSMRTALEAAAHRNLRMAIG